MTRALGRFRAGRPGLYSVGSAERPVCAARLLCAQETEGDAATEYEQEYGLVYQQASKLTNVNKLLIVKGESDEVEEVTDALAEVSASIGSPLEMFAASRAKPAFHRGRRRAAHARVGAGDGRSSAG